MSSFTKGPWHYAANSKSEFSAYDVIASNEVNGYICTTSGNSKANARLIAKAPEMFELLNEVRVHLQWQSSGAAREYSTIIEKLLAEVKGDAE